MKKADTLERPKTEQEVCLDCHPGAGQSFRCNDEGKCYTCGRQVFSKDVAKLTKPLPQYDTTRAVAQPFEVYLETHLPLIKEIQGKLQTVLGATPESIEEQMRDIERYQSRTTDMAAFFNGYLDLAERQRLVPYDRGSYTDTDRAVELGAAVARERRVRDIVVGLSDAIKQRVNCCQSLLKHHQERFKHGA